MKLGKTLKSKLTLLLALQLYCSSFWLPISHADASEQEVKEPAFFEDHFDRSAVDVNWSVIDGSFATANGVMSAQSGFGSKALMKDIQLEDGSIEADIRLASRNGDAGLLFRAVSATPGADNVKGYYAGISAQGTGSVFLGRMDNKWTELKRVNVKVDPNTSYRFKVVAVGSQIKFYVNDQLVLEQTDSSYTKGGVGVRLYQSQPTFDNVLVSDQDDQALFSDNFESNVQQLTLPGWQSLSGSWQLQNGSVTVNADANQELLVQDKTFKELSVEADITLPSAEGAAGLLFRSQDSDAGTTAQGYYAALKGDGKLVLSRLNQEWTELKSTQGVAAMTANQAYQLKVVTYGSSIKVYIDDMHTPALEYNDTSENSFAAGGVGLWADQSRPLFDHFIATDYEVPKNEYKEPVANKSPLLQTPFVPLPLGSVKADGWLLKQLELMKDGATGYAEDLYGELNSNSEWLGGTEPDSNWERPIYYVKGLIALAYTLDEPDLIAKSQRWVNWMLSSQQEDGSFGPKSNNDWWPRMVAIYVLKDYYEATSDNRVIPFLTNYFHYQLANLDSRPLQDWGQIRSGDNLNVVLWLYNRTGDAFLLELAEKLHEQGTDATDVFTNNKFLSDAISNPDNFYTQHTVNVNQSIKTPAIYYQLSKDGADKEAYQAGVDHLDASHNQITGINSGTEMLAGLASTQGVELCAIVERIHSDAVTAMITGDPAIGDALEKLTFNSLPGAMSKDIKTHQYYSLPNQVKSAVTDNGYKQNYDNGTVQSPFSGYPCCRFNMHMGWPYFVKDMWAGTADGGLGVIAYGPSRVSTRIKGADVTLKETTNYPFEDDIRFTVEEASTNVSFPLKLRIPEWTKDAALYVNGQKQTGVQSGEYYTINRTWQKGDEVSLVVPMEIKTSTWVNNSIGIERGPLVFSLMINEKWSEQSNPAPQVKASGFKSYNIDAVSPWNYGLLIDREHPEDSIQVVTTEMPDNPFEQATTPVKLIAKGKRIPAWGFAPNGVSAAEPPVGPVYSAEATEDITLVPFGAENLRVTYFPEVTDDLTAKPAKYEAEAAELNRAEARTGNAYASGSSYVGGIDYADSYVSFNEVTAPKDGLYKLYIWYAQNTKNFQPAAAKIIVNGEEELHTELAGTIGWGRFMATSVNVNLKEGSNSIRFMHGAGANAGYYELDYISLSAVDEESEQPSEQKASASLSGVSSVQGGKGAELIYSVQQVTDANFQSIYAQDVTITFDPELLSFSGASSLINGVNVMEPQEVEPGKVRMLVYGQGAGFSPNEDWLKLSFRAKKVSAAVEAVVHVSNVTIANGEGAELALLDAEHRMRITAPKPSGDMNQDDKVSIGDLAIVAAAYGHSSNEADWAHYSTADVNNDGIIDIEDLAYLARLITG